MSDIVERARLVQRVNAHWSDSICDCEECAAERCALLTPMADEIESLRSRLADLEAERALLVTRAENAEAALVAEVAKNGRHAMRVTIAQLEARLQKIMARCADLLDEDQFNELDAMTRATDPMSAATENPEAMYNPVARESHAGASARQIDVAAGASPSACNHFPGQSTCEWCSAVQPERCCLDYPRCDCNSPPESEGAE